MNFKEITGKTVEDAFTEALIQLETTSDNVDYEVIEKGSAGIFGIGSKPARIKAWKKDEAEAEGLYKKEEAAPVEVKAEKEVKETKAAAPVKAVKTEAPAKAERKVNVEEVNNSIKNFLEPMFKAMDMSVNVAIEVNEEDGLVNVDLSGDDMGILIGKRGQTLDSIQYLVSLVVNKENDKYLRVKVDTENYRQRRRETLESLAKNIAYKVKRSRRSVSLEPMNPYERRIIHSSLQNDKYVATKSEGEEPFRHVIVYLKNDYVKKEYNR